MPSDLFPLPSSPLPLPPLPLTSAPRATQRAAQRGAVRRRHGASPVSTFRRECCARVGRPAQPTPRACSCLLPGGKTALLLCVDAHAHAIVQRRMTIAARIAARTRTRTRTRTRPAGKGVGRRPALALWRHRALRRLEPPRPAFFSSSTSTSTSIYFSFCCCLRDNIGNYGSSYLPAARNAGGRCYYYYCLRQSFCTHTRN